MADLIINTSKFTVHELREFIGEQVPRRSGDESKILIYVTSFGYRHGVPPDSDLVFDVRFLPNPNYIPRVQAPDRPEPARGALHPLVSRRRWSSWTASRSCWFTCCRTTSARARAT